MAREKKRKQTRTRTICVCVCVFNSIEDINMFNVMWKLRACVHLSVCVCVHKTKRTRNERKIAGPYAFLISGTALLIHRFVGGLNLLLYFQLIFVHLLIASITFRSKWRKFTYRLHSNYFSKICRFFLSCLLAWFRFYIAKCPRYTEITERYTNLWRCECVCVCM